MPIIDLARDDVVTSSPTTSVAEIAGLMEREHVGSVVITNGNDPIGIITDRDLTLRTLGEGKDPSEMTAEDVMTRDLVLAEPEMGFYEAGELMAEHGIRRLPVCDSDGLCGIITADDLTELLADEQSHFAEMIKAQRPAY